LTEVREKPRVVVYTARGGALATPQSQFCPARFDVRVDPLLVIERSR
jgi:hypothetical protein